MVSPCQSGMFIHKRLKVLSRLTKKRKEFIGPELPDSVVHVLLLKKIKINKKRCRGTWRNGVLCTTLTSTWSHENRLPVFIGCSLRRRQEIPSPPFTLRCVAVFSRPCRNSSGSAGNTSPISWYWYWIHSTSKNIFLCHSSDLGSSPTAPQRQPWNALPNPINYLASKGRLNLCDKRMDFI